MASKLGMNLRIERATERINEVAPKVTEALGVDIGPLPQHRDKILLGALRTEWLADVLEAVATHVASEPTPIEPTPITRKRSTKSAA